MEDVQKGGEERQVLYTERSAAERINESEEEALALHFTSRTSRALATSRAETASERTERKRRVKERRRRCRWLSAAAERE